MPMYGKPLEVNCFKCENKFTIAYVIAKKDWSKKNNWGFWTEKKEEEGKEICNACLLNFYYYKRKEFYELVCSKKKQATFRNYLSIGKFS